MIILLVFAVALGILLVNKPAYSKEMSLDEHENLKEAIFAGGCFWCNEAAFEAVPGVIEVISGYTGGESVSPTYAEVSSGKTGHLEAVKVMYDSEEISYSELVELFWRQINPTDDEGQFVDKGSQYRTAIFYQTEEEKEIAEKSKEDLEKSERFDEPIVTRVLPAEPFYEAEEYHQDYSKKRTIRYNLYEKSSGRDQFKKIWDE